MIVVVIIIIIIMEKQKISIVQDDVDADDDYGSRLTSAFKLLSLFMMMFMLMLANQGLSALSTLHLQRERKGENVRARET